MDPVRPYDPQATQPVPTPRATRPLADNPLLADLAAQLLRTEGAMADLSAEDAVCVVGYMGLVSFGAGSTVFREGDSSNTSYLLLLLAGDVSVETGDPAGGAVTISVLGPGNIIGEMGLLDGSPRSTTCMASTPLQAGGLSRKALERLIEDHPKVGAKLMTGLAKRLAERLRGLGEQIGMYAQLMGSMQQEINALKTKLAMR